MDYEETIKIMNELEKIEEVIAPPRYRRCCFCFLSFVKHFVYISRMLKNLNNINERYDRKR